ncbi:MAG: Zn-dependent alcohol dehydrogenase [Candidatus Hydrogenedentota bacterium]
MKIKAAVVTELNKLEVLDVELDGPKAGEVLVKMVATGVCHSDLSVINGKIPARLPFVIGHEGAGIVEKVGEGVDVVEAGDHVVLAFVPHCGECFFCEKGQPYLCKANNILGTGTQLDGTSRVTIDGEEVRVMSGLGCMAEYCVVPSISLVKVEKDISLHVGALVGCGVTTGVGAALNTAKVEEGSTVAVLGCGGVGIAVIQGARIAGAAKIIAIDTSEEKLEMAKGFGATDGVLSDENTVKAIKDLTDGIGVDYAFEVIGITDVMELAYTITRNGGTTIIVGVGSMKDRVSFNALTFSLKSKKVCGCMYGSSDPVVDFPKYLGLYKEGKLDLDGMISKTYGIGDANEAFDDLLKGGNARGVIAY